MFLRLILTDSDGTVLGANTYWHNRKEYQNYRALREIPKTSLSLDLRGSESFTDEKTGREMTRVTCRITNGAYPALNVRLRLLNPDGSDLLPVFFSDNYLFMMPGEVRTVTAEYETRKAPEGVRLMLSSWNSTEN